MLPASVCAEIFYVDNNGLVECNDNNPGNSVDAPWCTIAKANAELEPGDEVQIRSGTYSEVILPKNSGQINNPITYKAYPGEQPVIIGSSGEANVVSIGGLFKDWKSKSYIIIDGLTIKRGNPDLIGNTTHALVSIYGKESTHNTIKNCTLIGTEQSLLSAWNHGQGLRVGGIGINKSSYNIIEKNVIKNMTYVGIAIGADEPEPALFNIIRGNQIYSILQDAVHIDSEKASNSLLGLLIEENTISNILKSDGIQANGCHSVATADCAGVLGVIVRNNIIYDVAENAIDLKGTRYWLIDNNIFYRAIGNNDGGLLARSFENCETPPCNNTEGGPSICIGGNKYSRDIIIRNNIIFDSNSAITVGDQFIIYNNTILSNRRTYQGLNQEFCFQSSCSRKPAYPGLYDGQRTQSNGNSVILNNIIGSNGFAVYRSMEAKWEIDHNLYFWDNKEPFQGLANFSNKYDWQSYKLTDWQADLNSRDEVIGNDAHSKVATNIQEIFVKADPKNLSGQHTDYNFALKSESAAVNGGRVLTQTVRDGNGTRVQVLDARFFFDGFGITSGDQVMIGTEAVRIMDVDYASNEISIDRSIVWKSGDKVTPPYAGAAPDIGAKDMKQKTRLPSVSGLKLHE